MATLGQSIRRNAIGLGLFAIITGGTIALTHALTQDRIAQQIARAEAKALFAIIPENRHDNELLRDTIALPASNTLNNGEPLTAWVARRGDRPFGLILPVTAPDGYSGDIRLLIGIDLEGTILGVRVTNHRETPGLGDRVETKKSGWIYTFEGRSLDNPEPDQWAVKKNGGVFDQFTGATITPKAVVSTVRDTLMYFRKNRQQIRQIIEQPASPEQEPVMPESLAGGESAQERS
jgi:electron transport complex protein RnfG